MKSLWIRFFLFPLTVLPLFLLSQPAVWSPAGAGIAATAGAQAGMSGNFWSLYGNPAGMSGVSGLSFGTHVEQRFALRELSAVQGGMVAPIGENQAIGARISWFGLGEFGEGRYALSYSIEPLEGVRIGSSITYYQTIIPTIGSGRSLFVDVGIQVDVTEKLTIGAFGVNLNRATIQNLGEGSPLPTMIQAGLAFRASEKVTLMTDVSQELEGPLSLKAGIEYQPTDILYLRVGTQTGPSTVSAGFCLKMGQLQLDFASSYQALLGFTPHIGLTYQLGKNAE